MGIRLINWVWALELIQPADLIDGDLRGRLLSCVDLHLWEITRKYSRFSSANNHLVGEAVGVFLAAGSFGELRRASDCLAQSRAILEREIDRQTFPDGVNREQAFGYHLFVMELFLVAGLASSHLGEDFTSGYWNTLEKMFQFAAAMTEGGAPTYYGDCDDAYVLDLGDGPKDLDGLLAVGAAIFDPSDRPTDGLAKESQLRADTARTADRPVGLCPSDSSVRGSPLGPDGLTPPASLRLAVRRPQGATLRHTQGGQRVYWSLGPQGNKRRGEVGDGSGGDELKSRAFPDAGYYLLQRGHCEPTDTVRLVGRCDPEDRVSVLFDCGNLGFESIAAHGHADALQFTLRAFGCDVIVDPGTYDYFTYDDWRDYFRSTAAHNTIVIDGQDQSQMDGSFMWSHQAEARCLHWEPSEAGGLVSGEHDGYHRLVNPVTHRRTVTLENTGLTIRDELLVQPKPTSRSEPTSRSGFSA